MPAPLYVAEDALAYHVVDGASNGHDGQAERAARADERDRLELEEGRAVKGAAHEVVQVEHGDAPAGAARLVGIGAGRRDREQRQLGLCAAAFGQFGRIGAAGQESNGSCWHLQSVFSQQSLATTNQGLRQGHAPVNIAG